MPTRHCRSMQSSPNARKCRKDRAASSRAVRFESGLHPALCTPSHKNPNPKPNRDLISPPSRHPCPAGTRAILTVWIFCHSCGTTVTQLLDLDSLHGHGFRLCVGRAWRRTGTNQSCALTRVRRHYASNLNLSWHSASPSPPTSPGAGRFAVFARQAARTTCHGWPWTQSLGLLRPGFHEYDRMEHMLWRFSCPGAPNISLLQRQPNTSGPTPNQP
ncbi:hypothetical protein DFH07DRAFT_368950 [Mycena maculata]|uniref:Uncharacterized protein n=1 Tax=Mycena maculata TaxID=230809 RepID=A0AAD7H949_9AGAR|nr:hypothetical protein DFH07DRAFT_368950 [Mycena maculata]